MAEAAELERVLAVQIADPATSWSLGTFGAIAEFMRDPDEPVAMGRGDLSAATDRGAIRLRPPPGLRLVASEGPTKDGWSQRVALCLLEDRCAMSRRGVLTEVGPDTDAIRAADRDAMLFDLGLDVVQADLCVRASAPDLISKLRTCCGRPLFAPDNPAMSMILAANPPRVFISRVGRVEVFQPIPPASGKSPAGPHTHVLPKLLRRRRTHSAAEPIPDGWVPCAHFYPPHPVKDAYGIPLPYDSRRHEAFQALLGAFGDADLVALKRRMREAMADGHAPSVFAVPNGRFARASIRIGLRQILAANGPSPVLAIWQQAYERADAERDDLEEINH